MIPGDALTRFSIWAALGAYGVAVALMLGGRAGARWMWTLGLGAFVIHVLAAFHYYYAWSHAVGLRETARQTRELTGMNSGSGLYLNYVFLAVWVVDALYWWWVGDEGYARRARWIPVSLHAFFVFMIVNGAVIFASGPVRWLGALMVLGLLGQWLTQRRGQCES